MLEILIALLRAQLLSAGYFDKVYGLCVKVREGGKVYPAEYKSKDNYQKVDYDQKFIYFRQTGETQRREEDEGVTGCDDMVYETVPMVAVAYLPKDIFGSDNPYIDDKVSRNIANYIELAGWNNLRSTLKAENVHCSVRRVNHFRETVWREEFEGIEMAARHDHVLCSIGFDIEIRSTSGCLQNYECAIDSAVVEPCAVTVYIEDPRAWHREADNGESGYLGDYWQLTSTGDLIPVTTETVDVGSETKKIDNLWVKNLHYDVLIPPLPLSTILAEGNTTGGNDIIISAGDAITSPDGLKTIAVKDTQILLSVDNEALNMPYLDMRADRFEAAYVGVEIGSLYMSEGGTTLSHTTQVSINAPFFHIQQFPSVSMCYVDGNKHLQPVTVTAANGLSFAAGTLAMAAASDVQAGAVTTGTQTFGGAKTFNLPVTIQRNNNVQLTISGPVGGASSGIQLVSNANNWHIAHQNNLFGGALNFNISTQTSNPLVAITRAGSLLVGSSTDNARAYIVGASNGVALRVDEDGGTSYVQMREVAGVKQIGWFNATPVAQQTITGSRGGNAALADLLTKLALTGLIIDGTS